jgi:hypothetical protein
MSTIIKTKDKPIILKTDLSFDEVLKACLMTKPTKKRKTKKKMKT